MCSRRRHASVPSRASFDNAVRRPHPRTNRNARKQLIARFEDQIQGTVSGFDRGSVYHHGVRWRPSLTIYHYRIDSQFGWCHARIQTWVPFYVHMGVNGREWLARRMDEAGSQDRSQELGSQLGNATRQPHSVPAQAAAGTVSMFGRSKMMGQVPTGAGPAARPGTSCHLTGPGGQH